MSSLGKWGFRLVFLEHDDISDHHPGYEGITREKYIESLEESCHSEFSPNFLNIPNFDDQLYEQIWPTIRRGIKENLKMLLFIGAIFIGAISFLISSDRISFEFKYIEPPEQTSKSGTPGKG